MWRMFVGPVAGYITMVIVVISCIAAAWFTLGRSFAFEENSFNASLGWTVSMLISGFLAAMLGGMVARLIGGQKFGSKSVFGLAGLVFVFGVLTIVAQSMGNPPEIPEGLTPDNVSFAQAGAVTKSPTWYNYAIIVVGILGTLFGGNLFTGNAGMKQNI